ncbi:hypothetical protein JOC34_000524 [Virgibacillus halotolerans]|uniref:hypothetical protein n=1 Tax=Virgibacillus halotolerans TaxID=1071053 RepID=UPI00195F5C44|nr:hypothetical protein [Virgibacillus halotolerans]MBM7598167.1 hypothetical protein [Virgibacillus halotolerans]
MDQDRANQINDCFVDIVGRRPRMDERDFINEHLPRETKLEAEEWGWSDTEVGIKVFKWIKDNKELVLSK